LKADIFKYDSSNLRDLIQGILRTFIYTLIAGVFLDLLLNRFEPGLDFRFYLFICIYTLIFTWPAILLALNYYFSDRKVSLEIDYENETISIDKKKVKYVYKFAEIKNSVYHLGIFYKNLKDTNLNDHLFIKSYMHRRKMLWSNCGYWHLEFHDGRILNISSFVQDLIFEYPFINNTKYKFSFVPLMIPNKRINGSLLSCNYIRTAGMYNSRFLKLHSLYSEYSESKLKEIIENPNDYQKVAVKAANRVLNDRKNVG